MFNCEYIAHYCLSTPTVCVSAVFLTFKTEQINPNKILQVEMLKMFLFYFIKTYQNFACHLDYFTTAGILGVW